jgi:hypothetical protein
MSYFENFPLTSYELGGTDYLARNILLRSIFISEYRPYTDLFTPHTILDGETPQSLAKSIYGSQFYHWVILVTNEIHNPYFDWPLEQLDLERVCEQKYGTAMYVTRHYEHNGLVVGEVKVFKDAASWVPPTFSGLAEAVSFYDYEQELNDQKRYITILRPELLGEFVKQFGDSLNG